MGKSTQLLSNLPMLSGGDVLTEAIRGKLRDLIELLLGSELDSALKVARYDRSQDRAGYRNGTKPRTLHTSLGTVELDVPRARMEAGLGRTREWLSELLPRYERRTGSLDASLVSLYFSGVNQRRIRKALKPLAAEAPVGKNVVSRLVHRLREHLEAWKERSLREDTYVYVYLDATNLKVRLLGTVRTYPMFVALGVREDGTKEVLALEGLFKESQNAWMELLEGLHRRGMNRPILAIIDGSRGLRSALDAVWPGIKVQRCLVHKLRNLETYCPEDAYVEVKKDFYEISEAKNLKAAQAAYERFVRRWSHRLPKVAKSLEEAGPELLTFLSFPKEQWKCIRTTNPIERLNLEFKRRVKTQSSLPSEESALLIFFGLIRSGQIEFRKINGWQRISKVMEDQTLALRKEAS
jgi:putative transposase